MSSLKETANKLLNDSNFVFVSEENNAIYILHDETRKPEILASNPDLFDIKNNSPVTEEQKTEEHE